MLRLGEVRSENKGFLSSHSGPVFEMAEKIADQLVQEATVDLSAKDVPEPLQQSILNHQNNLIGLANALLAAGKDEQEIRDALDTIFASFKDEVARTIIKLSTNK